MQFKNPKTNTYVQVKADETNVQRYFEEMVKKGYGFVKYSPDGEQGRVGKVYNGVYSVPAVGRAMGGAIPGYADGGSYAPGTGGYIRGRGTPTSDSILLPTGNGGLIRASDTEFMQPASSVSYYGADFMEDLRARRIPKEIISAAMGGAIPGYARAGRVLAASHMASTLFNTETKDFRNKPGVTSANSPFLFDAETHKQNNQLIRDNYKAYEDGKLRPYSPVELADRSKMQKSEMRSFMQGRYLPGTVEAATAEAIASMYKDRSTEFIREHLNEAIASRLPYYNLSPAVGRSAKMLAAGGRTEDFIRHVLGISDPSIPVPGKAMGGAIPGYFDGGSIFSKIMKSAISPFGAAGFGLDILSKIDTYRKNKDLNKWVETSGDGAKWMEKKTVNPNAKAIYVYDMANRYDTKHRTPLVNQALKYLTGQTGVQFKRATFGMRNNPEVVKLNWADPQNLIDQGAAGSSVPGSRVVDLISPMGLNAFTLGRQGGQNTVAHEILHSLDIGDYSDNTPDSMFDGHAKNPFNLMFPSVGLTSTFVSKADTESLRYLTDFYNFQDKPIGKAMGGAIPGYHKGGPVGHRHKFGNPSPAPSQGTWWDKLQSEAMYAPNGMLDPVGMTAFGVLDSIKSTGAVLLDSLSNGLFPARQRDRATAAETTLVAQALRLSGDNTSFPSPFAALGAGPGLQKGLDIASIAAAIIPFGSSARTTQQTAANLRAFPNARPVAVAGGAKTTVASPASPATTSALSPMNSEGKYFSPPKGVPIALNPDYITALARAGLKPPTIIGGGSHARRGVTSYLNSLYEGLAAASRLDLLPTPKTIKFNKNDGEFIGGEANLIQMHQAIGDRNPAWLQYKETGIFPSETGKTTGPLGTTFFHELGHAWDLSSPGGGRSLDLFKANYSGTIDPTKRRLTRSQSDFYSGIIEGTADDYLAQIFPYLQGRLRPEVLDNIEKTFTGRTYMATHGKLTVADILAPGGAYLKKDGKVNPDRIHQVNSDFLNGYLYSRPDIDPAQKAALEATLAVLRKFYISRETIDNNKEGMFGYGSKLTMEEMLTDRLTKAYEYALANGLAMGGSVPKFHNGGQVNTKFAGGETMALLKDKEMVFTQDQMTALGSIASTSNQSVPTSITYAPVINAAPGMDENMLANLVMVKLGTATDIRYKANGSSGMRVIK